MKSIFLRSLKLSSGKKVKKNSCFFTTVSTLRSKILPKILWNHFKIFRASRYDDQVLFKVQLRMPLQLRDPLARKCENLKYDILELFWIEGRTRRAIENQVYGPPNSCRFNTLCKHIMWKSWQILSPDGGEGGWMCGGYVTTDSSKWLYGFQRAPSACYLIAFACAIAKFHLVKIAKKSLHKT